MRLKSFSLVFAAAWLATGIGGTAQDFGSRARELHKQTPLVDGHNDYPWALRGLDPGRDFAKADISKPVPKLMTDVPRLRQGGVSGHAAAAIEGNGCGGPLANVTVAAYLLPRA